MQYFDPHGTELKRKMRNLNIVYGIIMVILLGLGVTVLQYSLPHILARAKAEYDKAYAEAIADVQLNTVAGDTKR